MRLESRTYRFLAIIYQKFIRPHLEFTSSIWNPHLKYDSNTLESVQHSVTLIMESYHLAYHERLERLGLSDLSCRRERRGLNTDRLQNRSRLRESILE